jgi:hypothetical protein
MCPSTHKKTLDNEKATKDKNDGTKRDGFKKLRHWLAHAKKDA